MNSKIEHSKDNSANGGDIVKYVAASLLVLAGLFVWFWFSADSGRAAQLGAWAGQLRALAVVVGLVGGIGVFMLTGKGRDTREFLSESRFELRKVVWPTRQEAVRMTSGRDRRGAHPQPAAGWLRLPDPETDSVVPEPLRRIA